MSIAGFILSRIAPVATVGAGAAQAQSVGAKMQGHYIGTAIEVGAKTIENFVAAIFLSIGAFWLAPASLLPVATIIFGHFLVFTPLSVAIASYLARKRGDVPLADRLDRIDARLHTFTKGVNAAIYTLVAVIGTWMTYTQLTSKV